MMEQPIAHGGPDRAYRKCRCAKCGVVARCLEEFDFYTLAGDETGLLYCEACFRPFAMERLVEVTP